MLFFQPVKMSLAQALDLEIEGLLPQAARLRFTRASVALITVAALTIGASGAFALMGERSQETIIRESFADFPRALGPWKQVGSARKLDADIAVKLGADDYLSVRFSQPDDPASVEFFSAWYADQSKGGVHSPEICLPGGGWEIAWLERSDVAADLGWPTSFELNRAIIQKGSTRMMVYYWFDQKGRKIAWDFEAKFMLMVDGIMAGRTDGALVRLTTVIMPGEEDKQAEARLNYFLAELNKQLPRFHSQF